MNRSKLIATLQQIKALTEEALSELRVAVPQGKSGRIATSQVKSPVMVVHPSFNTNVLAFMNKYARGLKGPQKFTMLLARLVKGNGSQQVPRAALENHWNKMKVVLGGRFNSAHANRAKANGWVDSPKHG